jgi:hypothetical protein
LLGFLPGFLEIASIPRSQFRASKAPENPQLEI